MIVEAPSHKMVGRVVGIVVVRAVVPVGGVEGLDAKGSQ